MNSIQRKKNYSQVCVFPGTLLPEDQVSQFVKYFADNGFRVQHLETIMTEPDRDEAGAPIAETGGRSDVIFAIHDDDVVKFAIPRMQMGIRWIEDVLDNESRRTEFSIYPERFKEYRTW